MIHLIRRIPFGAAVTAVLMLAGCGGSGDNNVQVTAAGNFHAPVPADVARALQIAEYELLIEVRVDGNIVTSARDVRIDPQNKTIEPLSVNLDPGTHTLQLVYSAFRAVGCTGVLVELARTDEKTITVVANESTDIVFPEREVQRAADRDGDGFSNISEVLANVSPCDANSIPSSGPVVTTTTQTTTTTTTKSTTTTTTASTTSTSSTAGAAPVLSDLVLLPGRLEQDFQPTQTSYTAKVSFPVDSIYIVPFAANPGITIQVNDTTVESGQISAPIPLPQFDSVVNPITVAASMNGATTRYVIEVKRPANVFRQDVYIKGSNSDGAAPGIDAASTDRLGDAFGWSLAMNADGSVLAVGARLEDSADAADQANNGSTNAGAVYVFTRADGWTQRAYLKALNAEQQDQFGGNHIASDGRGALLAIPASLENGGKGGINPDAGDNSAPDAGAVYIFADVGGNWTQTAYLKASNPGPQDLFGTDVALSNNGDVLVVGAMGESSNAQTINGDESDNSMSSAGAVYAFAFSPGDGWTQTAYVKAPNTDANDQFGECIALSKDGRTLAVGAAQEDSSATGVDGAQADNSATDSGAVYIFTRSGAAWSFDSYIKASNTGAGDLFGCSLALSADGSLLAVGAPGEDSRSTGINGRQTDEGAPNSGAAYIFTRAGNTWIQQTYIKSTNSKANDGFGQSISLSADGNRLIVAAPFDNGAVRGINPDQNDDAVAQVGGAYLFVRDGNTWTQEVYIKSSNGEVADRFGTRSAISADGSSIVLSSHLEDSNAHGINGDQMNNGAVNSGAVYVFR